MLLKRKCDDTGEKKETKILRSSIREQPHAISLQVSTLEGMTILPYAYLQETRCRRKGAEWELTLYWPWVALSIKGRNLHKLSDMIAEHKLATLECSGPSEPEAGRPEIESLVLTSRAAEHHAPPPTEARPQQGASIGYRQSYSVA